MAKTKDKPTPTKKNNNSKDKNKELSLALDAVRNAWGDESAWDRVEALADLFNDPKSVADLYSEALEVSHPEDVFDLLANRAVMFFEEWFSDDQDAINGLLSAIIEKNNLATWAFDRLTEFMTIRERWDDLFDVYDRLLGQELPNERRKALLEEASNIASDIADNPEKSLTYLTALHALDRSNFQRFHSIERMLEQYGRWDALILLRRGQMPLMSSDDLPKTWIKIAKCYFEKLANPEQAFVELKTYLHKYPDDTAACEQMVRLLSDEHFALADKLEAIKLLNDAYIDRDRKEDAVLAIETVIPFCDDKAAVSLHRMAASHLALLNKDDEAIGHLASLLLLDPGDADALKNIRLLSVRVRKPGLRADALAKAAQTCRDDFLKVTHLLDAARIYADELNEHKTAIGLLTSVAQIPDIEPGTALLVAHKLNELFAAEGLKEERLKVLSQLAELEKTDILRRAVVVEAARLAGELGNTAKALSLWQTLVDKKPDDREALSAVIELLEQREEYDALAQTLVRRAEISDLPEQRRVDLVRAAELYRERLNDPERAGALWRTVFNDFGPRKDAVHALDSLLTESQQFEELFELLNRSIDGKFDRMRDILLRAAKISAAHLKKPETAFEIYKRVLVLEPSSPNAIEGMESLLLDPSISARAVDALVAAHRATDDWGRLLALTPRRLETAKDVAMQIDIYLNAAQIQKNRAENPKAAVELLTRVLPLDPENHKIEAEMIRLAKAHGCWDGTEAALGDAASALDDNPKRRAHLKYLAGWILENVHGQEQGALDAYMEATELAPRDPEALESMCRVATRLRRWSDASLAFLKLTRLEDEVDTERLDAMHQTAKEQGELSAMLEALTQLLSSQQKIRASVRRQLESSIATFYRNDCDNLKAAEQAAARAVAAESDHMGSLALLASIEKDNESAGLVETLERIFDIKKDNLDILLQAAIAASRLFTEYADIRRHLMKLYEESSTMWRLGKRAVGERDIETCCHFATWEVAKLDETRGLWEQAAELLVESAALPFDAAKAREMRLKAASLYAENGMNGAAIKVYMIVWQEKQDDVEVLGRLEHLLDVERRSSELIGVKTKLLELTADDERQVALRLDIARLAGILEGSDVRIEMLLSNLAQIPGHEASVHQLIDILRQRQMFEELSKMLTDQANQLAERAANDRAAVMMLQAARVYEENLNDIEQAIVAYERVLDLDDLPAAMDALARLHASQNRLKHAVSWLKRRLAAAKPQDRISVLLRLARTQLRAGQNMDAVSTLEHAFDEAPKHPEIRTLLLKEYRAVEDYESLASVLSRASVHLSNPSTALAYSAEAAQLYFRLHVPDRAVDVLERACELAPEDQKFKSMLAEALIAAGKHDRAEELLKARLKEFGRRRSMARGAIHLQLAKLARARRDVKESVAQLELATAMDTHNVSALTTLAELNRDFGDLEQAERNYRALLLLVRRESPKDSESPIITPGEILLELSFIASARNQTDKAAELEEKVFAALFGDPDEIARISARLEGLALHELLARVYERFLSVMDAPAQRARIRSRLSDLFAGPLNRLEDAFELRLKAVSEDPCSPILHDAAEQAAREVNQYERYIVLIHELIEASRREGDELSRCELLIRLAHIHAAKNDLDKAWNMYEQASTLSVREVDVLKLGIELAQARGDHETEVDLLSKLSKLAESAQGADAKADALYRLAEINLAVPETFEEGMTLIKQGFEESPNCARASRILMRAFQQHGGRSELLGLLEKVVRQSDDRLLRLTHHELKANLPDARASEIRDGAELALSLGEGARAEALMRRILAVNGVDEEDKNAVTWASLTLAEQRKAAGDLEGAFTFLKEAGESATSPGIFDIGLAMGEQLRADGSKETLVIEVYKWLLTFDPSDQRALEPLAELYAKKRDIDGFEGLIQESLYTIVDPGVRNRLRLSWSKLLLSTEDRKEDALDALKNIQLDEPAHEESIRLIAQYYLESDRQDELIEYLEYRFASAKSHESADEAKVIALILGPLKKREDPKECPDIYRAALELLPGDRSLLEHLAANLEGEEHVEERVKIKEQLLSTEPDETVADAAAEVIVLYRQRGDEANADRVLKSAYLRAPRSEVLEKMMEESYRHRGDYQGLMELLQKQADGMTDPESKAKTLVEMARLARDEFHDLPREIEALKEAVSISDKDADAWLKLMEALSDASCFDEVIEIATKALEKFTQKRTRAAILNIRGPLLRKNGEKGQGLRDLQEAFALVPRTAAINFGKALQELLKIARNEGDADAEKEYLMQYINVLALTKKSPMRRTLLTDWLERQPYDLDVMEQLLAVEKEDEQWEAAADIAEKIVYMTTGEEQVKAVLSLVNTCILAEQLEVASRGLEHVYKENPDNFAIREALMDVYEKTGEYSEVAAMLLEDAMKETDERKKAKLLRRAGVCLAHAGEGEAALHTLHRALAIIPEDEDTCLALIDMYMARSDLDMANEFADRCLARLEGSPSKELSVAQYKKAIIMGAFGDKSQELFWMEQAFLNNLRDGNLAIQLANLAEDMEEWDLAQKALDGFGRLKEEFSVSKAEALLRQAKISYYYEEDPPKGIKYAEKALKADPDFEAAKAFLKAIGGE